MGTLQDLIERVGRQFRGVEGLRRLPIGALGPLPSPRREAEVAILGHNSNNHLPGTNQEGMYSDVGAFPDPTARVPVPFAGVASALVVRVEANTFNAETIIELLKNGVATGMKITVPAGTPGTFGPAAGSISFAQKDRASFQIVSISAEGGAMTGPTVSVRYDPS